MINTQSIHDAAVLRTAEKVVGERILVSDAIIGPNNISINIPAQSVVVDFKRFPYYESFYKEETEKLNNEAEYKKSGISYITVVMNKASNFGNYRLAREGFQLINYIELESKSYPEFRSLAMVSTNDLIHNAWEIPFNRFCMPYMSPKVFYTTDQMHNYLDKSHINDKDLKALLIKVIRTIKLEQC